MFTGLVATSFGLKRLLSLGVLIYQLYVIL